MLGGASILGLRASILDLRAGPGNSPGETAMRGHAPRVSVIIRVRIRVGVSRVRWLIRVGKVSGVTGVTIDLLKLLV